MSHGIYKRISLACLLNQADSIDVPMGEQCKTDCSAYTNLIS